MACRPSVPSAHRRRSQALPRRSVPGCGSTAIESLAAEIKLGGGTRPDEAATALLRLRNKVNLDKTGERAKLVIVTAGGYAYERPDGVAVVPLTAMRE